MTLEDQFYKLTSSLNKSYQDETKDAKQCVSITEDFAMRFLGWTNENIHKYPDNTETSELVAEFKKQNNY